MSNHTPLRLPETMHRRDIGPYLGSLRVHFGLSEHDVADRLHIRVRYLQAIEQDAFDQLPGQVYARGYLFTYAEFLGLDAAQVVELCFGPQRAPAHIPPPMSATAKQHMFDATQWRTAAIIALVCGIVLLVAAQLHRHTASRAPETVPPVPEELLTTHHTLVMPTPRNLDCLTSDAWFACMQSSRAGVILDYINSDRLSDRVADLASMPEMTSEAEAPQPALKPIMQHKKPEYTKAPPPQFVKQPTYPHPFHALRTPSDTFPASDEVPVDHNATDGQ